MKTNGKHEVNAGIARQSLVLAALLAVVLSAGSITRAQSSAPSAAAPAAKTVAAPAEAPASATAKPTAKVQQQGIMVSGRWVIEVRNPDGKVTAHREFENAIQPAGMTYLAALLAGNNAPGQLSIMLNGAESDFCASTYYSVCDQINLTGGLSGPCGAYQSGVPPPTISGVGIDFSGIGFGGPCIITAAANKSSYSSLLGAACLYYSGAGDPFCSTNLTTTAPTVSTLNYGGGLSASLTLGGTVVANYPAPYPPGYITDVETIFETCSSGSTPSGCTGSWDISKTSKGKPGVSWVGMNLFTEATLPSPGVAYITGQTISATVTFTFSSPSS
jgi:hypothetical protein